MKHAYLLFAMALMLFSGCDWNKNPNIVGLGKVELDSKNRFVCRIYNRFIGVDSVLLANKTEKIYADPYVGQEVTCFSFGGNELYFYEGWATSDEIKNVYYIGDHTSDDINFTIFVLVCACLYGCLSSADDEDEDVAKCEKHETQESQQLSEK